MRHFKQLLLVAALGVFMLPATPSKAQVSFGIGVGVPEYGPPVCQWGYYPYAPYACAPYGYYGSDWFVNGLFIGAGPWYHRGYYGHGYGRGYYGHGYGYGHGVSAYRGGYSHGYAGGYAHGYSRGASSFHGGGGAAFRGGGGSFHGGGGGGFHGGGGSHGGGGFHGGGGGHGGRR